MIDLLVLAAGLFLATHLGISGLARGLLVERLGTGAYLGLYTLIAFVSLGLLIYAWVVSYPHVDFLFSPAPFQWLPWVLTPIALVLVIGGNIAPNPTNVGGDGLLQQEEVARGMLRITRHPTQWGISLWAFSHLLANGDRDSVVFFGTFIATAAVGVYLMERRKARTLGDDWQRFVAGTSLLPFAAVFSGRCRWVWGEMVLPLLIGAAVTAAALWGHGWISGVPLF